MHMTLTIKNWEGLSDSEYILSIYAFPSNKVIIVPQKIGIIDVFQ